MNYRYLLISISIFLMTTSMRSFAQYSDAEDALKRAIKIIQDDNLKKYGKRFYGDTGVSSRIDGRSPASGKVKESPTEYYTRTGERMSVKDYEIYLQTH